MGEKIKEERKSLGKVFSIAKKEYKKTLAKWYFSFLYSTIILFSTLKFQVEEAKSINFTTTKANELENCALKTLENIIACKQNTNW